MDALVSDLIVNAFALPASASPLLAGFEVYTVLWFALKWCY